MGISVRQPTLQAPNQQLYSSWCMVSVGAGRNPSVANSSVCLTVAPLIMAVETTVMAVTGMETTLRCTATGDPVPLQTWTRNGAAIADSRFRVMADGSTLMISDVREEDQGEYQCHASNLVGSNSATVSLNVIS